MKDENVERAGLRFERDCHSVRILSSTVKCIRWRRRTRENGMRKKEGRENSGGSSLRVNQRHFDS